MATTKKTPSSKAVKETPPAQPEAVPTVENIMMKTDLKNFKDGNFVTVLDASDGDILTTDWLPEMTERQAQLQFELLYDDLVFAMLDDSLSGCVVLLMRASIGEGRKIQLVNVKALRRDQDSIDPKIITAMRRAVSDDPLLVFKRGTGFIDITAPAASKKPAATKAPASSKGAVAKAAPSKKPAVKKAPAAKAGAPSKTAAVKKTAPAKKAPARKAPAVKKTAAVKRTAPVKKTA